MLSRLGSLAPLVALMLGVALAVPVGQAVAVLDTDGDGVADQVDRCAATPRDDVANTRGCGFAELRVLLERECPCAGPVAGRKWRSAKAYRRCVRKVVRGLRLLGHVDDRGRGLRRAARHSTCGRRRSPVRCCIVGKGCVVRPAAACTRQGGVVWGEGSCEPAPCRWGGGPRVGGISFVGMPGESGGESFSAAALDLLLVKVQWEGLEPGHYLETLHFLLPGGRRYGQAQASFDVAEGESGATVEVPLAVAGSYIVQNSLYGDWGVRVYLDGSLTAAASFKLDP